MGVSGLAAGIRGGWALAIFAHERVGHVICADGIVDRGANAGSVYGVTAHDSATC